jgi:hypothetical protein
MYDLTVITVAQQNAIAAVFEQWQYTEGDYMSTMLEGIVHAYCDSGIMTDAFSVDDAARIEAAGLNAVDDEDTTFTETHTLNEINAAVVAHDKGAALECVQAINAISAVSTDNVDTELLCYYMWVKFLTE